jgi:hypothetical protein
MKISENNRKPRILVLGASGLTGSAIASILDDGVADIEVMRAARNKEQVEMWKRDGKQAVYLDLDDARTFPAALKGIDRLFLLTGYAISMLHQSKTIVDAAADSGVNFIVHQGVFGKVDRPSLISLGTRWSSMGICEPHCCVNGHTTSATLRPRLRELPMLPLVARTKRILASFPPKDPHFSNSKPSEDDSLQPRIHRCYLCQRRPIQIAHPIRDALQSVIAQQACHRQWHISRVRGRQCEPHVFQSEFQLESG